MCISIIGSLVSMLAPHGEGGGLSKNIKLCLGLCVVIVCINPIKDIIYQINSFELNGIAGSDENAVDKYNDYFDSSYSASEVEILKDGIHQLLADRYGIERGESEISVKLKSGQSQQTEIESICITLYGTAIFKNTEDIEDYLGSLFGCEIVTIIG